MVTDAPLTDAAGLRQRGAAALAAAGLPTPRREAGRLWRDLFAPDGAPGPSAVGDDQARHYLEAIGRRSRGEPLAYVTGWAGFRHLVLASDRRALIPRVETEGLVDRALDRVSTGAVADIGTGTGAVALALAQEGEFDQVIGIDLSDDALTLARENGARLGLAVEWRHGDLLDPLADHSLDLVVANPPYLSRDELAALDPAVAAWEPHLALDGGHDGLAPYRRLLSEAPRVLRPDGWIALEIDARRADATAALAADAGWHHITIDDDLFGRARYLLARWEMT